MLGTSPVFSAYLLKKYRIYELHISDVGSAVRAARAVGTGLIEALVAEGMATGGQSRGYDGLETDRARECLRTQRRGLGSCSA